MKKKLWGLEFYILTETEKQYMPSFVQGIKTRRVARSIAKTLMEKDPDYKYRVRREK